jgi:TPR repeat protein
MQLLSLAAGCNAKACHAMMYNIARRVDSKMMEAVRDKFAKEAEELCASGQCAAALLPLQCAINFGDLSSLALMAWMLIDGRKGIVKDPKKGFELAEEGARFGCHHCQGVLAYCYRGYWYSPCGIGCLANEKLSLELAEDSSKRGSRYGQLTLGQLHLFGKGGLARDKAQAVAFYRLAVAQNLDVAQHCLGSMYEDGFCVDQDLASARRLYQLAGAQGHPNSMFRVAYCYENGLSVAADVVVAILWYKLAQDAGYPNAARALQRLKA